MIVLGSRRHSDGERSTRAESMSCASAEVRSTSRALTEERRKESGQERQRDGTMEPALFPVFVTGAGHNAGDLHAMSIPRTPTRLPRILYLPWSSSKSDSCLLSFLSPPSLHSHAKHGVYSHEAHRARTRQAPKPPRSTRITHSKSKSSRRARDSRVSRLGTAR